MPRATIAAVIGLSVLIGCALPIGGRRAGHKLISAAERQALLGRAQVWTPTNVRAKDIRRGPQRDGFLPDATVACDFVAAQFGGRTPKFGCALTHDDVLKVRYGRDNGEVYAGVAATRLLWALGFGADAMYPVHVLCHGCPRTLEAAGDITDDGLTFDVAAVERKFPGREVEAVKSGGGWAWPELDLVDSRAGGAPRPERDALKLLAVLLQHSDSKADQQRLVCRDGSRSREDLAQCAEPFMLIHDVGQTFGRANLLNRSAVGSVNFDLWSKTPVWKDPVHCVGNLAPSQTGTLTDPVISEPGRRFLADLLEQLSDEQLRDLFTVARFADKPHGSPVAAWVDAFKHKRDEISAAICP